jgi:hypothetical protein
MSKIRVLKVEESGIPGQSDALRILPGSFSNDREAVGSLQESGNYLFLEVHEITVESKEEKKSE